MALYIACLPQIINDETHEVRKFVLSGVHRCQLTSTAICELLIATIEPENFLVLGSEVRYSPLILQSQMGLIYGREW